ncbi:DNA replication and repair protein RecN [Palleronia marisminoris]|uniref:DNA repair protein RecN n=1 Tax=Palleronia marisminoris TaxID=315423 RepID=A0A1Y5RR00_9RHOB|nr:DNA repair protein RecN [Palleronia marisminoris]SFG54387.1 DNA replication and repair protein RecN [Palleronia marisminoris]SLN23072.1 DNA repair protein RecN [Palleronia marisminoris]
MLRGLSIRDMLLIDRLDLEFQPGLNVLTGETGAGKSILLDSLGFVLGWRGRAELVRQGAEKGEVTAEFDLPIDHPARDVLQEAGIDVEDELILRRTNAANGRKTAWINDRRASGDILRRVSESLVELHGQHDDRGLLDPRGHRALLDEFSGADAALAETRTAWNTRAAVARKLKSAEAALETARGEEDYLRHAVEELDQLDPQLGEDAELDTLRRRMQSAERVREDIIRAHQALGPKGAEGLLGDAARWLDGAAEGAEGALDAPMEALARALNDLAEAEQGVAQALDALDFDPSELERVEERLFAIRGLARKYDTLPDALGTHASDLRARLEALDAGEGDIADLRTDLARADAAYAAAADRLSAIRRDAATRLDAAMAAELAPLKMERAVFTTRVEPVQPGPEGNDAVEFAVATNPGAPAGPLGRIASGGELSRFLLALKVCLTREAEGLTLIFDEIDRGVGGATADAVGRRLQALADGAQVLVVTHSAQVAAKGTHHWRVEKRVADGVTTSHVVPLGEGARVDEIARMISGDTVTDEARAAARTLLSGPTLARSN